ncbi:unnamed protein product [Victoria cruziana]
MVSSQRDKSLGIIRKGHGECGWLAEEMKNKRRGECGWRAERIKKKGKEVVGMRFFRIMVGDFASKLCIPPAVARHIKMHKFADATINSHTGSPWSVKLQKHNKDMFIANGWREFSACHSLQFGDFLMFTYNGYLGFDLKIFDRSGCERPPAYLHKCAMIDRKEAGEPYSADEDLPILGLTQNQIVNHQEVLCLSDNLVGMGSYCYASKRKPVTRKERDRALRAAVSLKLSRPHFLSKMVRTNVYEIFSLS